MSEDSDKNIWNDRTIERLAELTTKKCNSTERYSITSTPVKRESPSKVNKNIGKKYKASSLPTSPNKTKVLQRRALEQSKVNTSNFTNSNNGSPKKDHKNFNKTNNSAKKNNTPNYMKDTLQEKLENDEYMLYDTLSKEVSPVISQDQLVDEIDAGDNENCCPVCGKSLKKHTLEESNLHVTECLDNPSGSSTLTTSELSIETKHTILQSNDPSSWNALFSFKSKFTSIQNSQPTIKSHLDNEMKKDTTVKPTSKKECPWYKKLQGTNITVDAFKYGRIPNCTAYFLSHFHSDHYVGLSQKWSHGPIYCSSVTGNLVIQQLRVKPQYVRKLPMNEEVVINNTDTVVTLIDANHCPGSVLFLFKTKCANGETKRYLHTGDFRACPRQVLHSAIVQPNNPPIDILYLDTTYLNERYCFPAQEQ
ncbi:11544_t:CDS:2, partial [Scutellospora calospora]